MANLITLLRLLLLFVLVGMAYFAPPGWQLINPVLLLVVIALDGVDGYIARKRNETSVFGSIFDIAVDRVVENVLWVVLADLNLIPAWVALLFVTRGILVDSVRGHGITQGKTAFGMMETPLGRFLVASRFMRGLYGAVKAITFAWIFLLQPLPTLYSAWWNANAQPMLAIADALVYASVALCLVRGVPVLVEFALAEWLRRKESRLQETH